GRIKCRERSLYFIPSLSSANWRDLPAVIGKIVGKTVFGNRDAGGGMVAIINENTWRAWSFVNYPRVTPRRSASGAITATGWFHDRAGGSFPEIGAESRDGSTIESTFERVASPDLAAHFGDPSATESRFVVRFFCPDECMLVASRPGIAPLRVGAGSAPQNAEEGTSRLFIEKVEGPEVVIDVWQGPAEAAAGAIRDALLAIYTLLAPLVMGLGVLAALAACLHAAFSRSVSVVLVAALTAWSVVFVRIVMLALVDVSAFSGTPLIYSLPSIHMALIASVLSMLSAVRDIEQGRVW
ncbi:MAG: hypothetical protein VYD64_01035, partial [Pseudomonadota bacterium]|nr:hypothetical protein [Pseudomonadota bacterium]